MCGFIGSFSPERPLGATQGSAASLDALAHRGPDAQGWFLDEHAVMGFRRLAIIDRAGGGQPLFNEDEQVVLTVNGEIYNHRELRQGMQDSHSFRSGVDGEVLVHLYERHGLDLLEGVNGMFAFALYDRRRRRLVLGRDKVGKKPLYWSCEDGVLRWGSELRALVDARSHAIDPAALTDYLRFGYVPAPRTIYQGIHRLPAGHQLVCERGRPPRLHCYWAFTPVPDRGGEPSAEEGRRWREQLVQHLSAAVGRRLESEVPMGYLLSAGLDSASVFALAARKTSPGPVQAFTIGFADQALDESAIAARLAGSQGARHHVRMVGEAERADLERVLREVEEPISTDALLPTGQVFRSVRQAGITVVMSGEGGDELFAGYAKFAHACPWLPGAVAPDPALSPLERYLAHEEFVFQPAEIRGLVGREWDRSSFARHEAEAGQLDPLGQMLLFEVRLRLPDRINLRLDKLSMASSLEARAPFMDSRLVEFAGRIPRRLLHSVRRGEKSILREAMDGLLPPEITRRPKAPFRAPDRWFTTPEELNRVLGGREVAAAGLVDPQVVARLVARPQDRATRERLYSLYVLHAWHRACRAA